MTYPAGPKKESWNPAGGDRPLPYYYEKLYQQMHGWLGRDKY
jgi:hypothetical protein